MRPASHRCGNVLVGLFHGTAVPQPLRESAAHVEYVLAAARAQNTRADRRAVAALTLNHDRLVVGNFIQPVAQVAEWNVGYGRNVARIPFAPAAYVNDVHFATRDALVQITRVDL